MQTPENSIQPGASAASAHTAPTAPNAQHIELVLSRIEALPTLSVVATRLLKLTGNTDADYDEVVSLIEMDPALSGRLLSLCRRASTGAASTVTTVRRAVVMLGIEAVQAAVLSVQIYEVLSQAPQSAERRDEATHTTQATGDLNAPPVFNRIGFWQHSIAVASCAELLADSHRHLKIRPDEAFTAGLIHDLGKLVLDWILPRTYAHVIAQAEAKGCSIASIERSLIGIDHHLAGKRLAEQWGLPHSLQDVIWLHGQPFAALPDVRHAPMIALVTAADTICRRLHLGWSGSCDQPVSVESVCDWEQLESSHLAGSGNAAGLDEPTVRDLLPRLHEALARRSRDLGLNDHSSPELVVQSIVAANAQLARLHASMAQRSGQSKVHARALDLIARHAGRCTPGSTLATAMSAVLDDVLLLASPRTNASAARPSPDSLASNASPNGFAALVVQARPGDPWRLIVQSAGPRPERSAVSAIEPPGDGRGNSLDLTTIAARPGNASNSGASADDLAGQSLGSAIGLVTWLSEHLPSHCPNVPDVRTLQLLPLGRAGQTRCDTDSPSPAQLLSDSAAPCAVLLHDGCVDVGSVGKAGLRALCSVWVGSLSGACQHEGSRRVSEALADTGRRLSEAQQRLTDAASMARMAELTAGAAHEMNNPLTVISGRAQLLAARLRSSAEKADAAAIVEAAGRLSDLVTRLHTVARPPEPEMAVCPLGDVLAEAVMLASSRVLSGRVVNQQAKAALAPPVTDRPALRAGKKPKWVPRVGSTGPRYPVPAGDTDSADGPGSTANPAAGMSVSAKLPPIRITGPAVRQAITADRTLLTRAIAELITNAIEANPPTGIEIHAAFDLLDDRLTITVQDDGVGMDDHALKHAFEPFYSNKPAGRQTGLGLALARRLVGLHGGAIRLTSIVGRGTVASVQLGRSSSGQMHQLPVAA